MIMSNQLTEDSNQYSDGGYLTEQINNQGHQFKKDIKVKIYPNLTNGILSIESEQKSFENYQLNVTDSQGRIIYTMESIERNKIQLNLNDFNRGIYAITIIDRVNKQATVKNVIYN